MAHRDHQAPMASGAYDNASVEHHGTAFQEVLYCRSVDIAKLLLQSIADANTKRGSIFKVAAAESQAAVAKLLQECGAVDIIERHRRERRH